MPYVALNTRIDDKYRILCDLKSWFHCPVHSHPISLDPADGLSPARSTHKSPALLCSWQNISSCPGCMTGQWPSIKVTLELRVQGPVVRSTKLALLLLCYTTPHRTALQSAWWHLSIYESIYLPIYLPSHHFLFYSHLDGTIGMEVRRHTHQV